MKKDAIYRLKNHAMMPWRDILYGVAKRFQTLTNPEKVVVDTSAFIIDDTTDAGSAGASKTCRTSSTMWSGPG